jgi:hypothetical protein
MRRGLAAELSDELVIMAEEDRGVRAQLSTDDPIGYERHPMMVDLCRRNAERLNAIIDIIGWPVARSSEAPVGLRCGSWFTRSPRRT